MTSRTAHISRADLLRLIDSATADEGNVLAALVGFERRESGPKRSANVDLGVKPEEQPFVPPPETKAESRSAIEAPVFWRVVRQQVMPELEIDDDDVPAWWRNRDQTNTVGVPPAIKAHQEGHSLLRWPRLLGFFRTHLITERRSQALDERRFVRATAKSRIVKRIPRKAYRRWPQQVVVLTDHSDALYPLWKDYALLRKRLTELLGARLTVINVAARREPALTDFQSLLIQANLSPEGAASARWLILTDAGAAGDTSNRAAYWQAFASLAEWSGVAATSAGTDQCPDFTLVERLGRTLTRRLLGPRPPVALRVSRGPRYGQRNADPDLSKLLAMLSMAPEARPRLLRELRRLLPSDTQDVSWEIAAWNHPDVRYCLPDCYVHSSERPSHQAYFLRCHDSLKDPQEWPHRAQKAIENHLSGTRAFIRDQAKAWERAANKQTDDAAGYIVEAIEKLRDLPAGSERDQLARWVDQVDTSTVGQLIAANDKLAALRYMAKRERRLRGESTQDLDSGFDFIFARKPERACLLWQQGTGWGIKDGGDADLAKSGSPIGALRSRNRVFEMWSDEGSSRARGFWASGVAPAWASDWGEDGYGRWVEFRIENQNHNS